MDTTLYKVAEKNPLKLEEVKSSACKCPRPTPDALTGLITGIQAGGIFVDKNAKTFFQERFNLVNTLSSGQRSRCIDYGLENFINSNKLHFDNMEDEVIVKVGGITDDFVEIEVDSGDMIIPS